MRRHEDFRDGRGLSPIKIIWNARQMIFGHRDVFSLAAAADDSENAIANLPGTHFFADGFDLAGKLNSGNVLRITGWRGITAESLQNVSAIQTRGPHADADAIERGVRRVGHVADFKAFDAAERGDGYCTHLAHSPFPIRRPATQWATARTTILSFSIL